MSSPVSGQIFRIYPRKDSAAGCRKTASLVSDWRLLMTSSCLCALSHFRSEVVCCALHHRLHKILPRANCFHLSEALRRGAQKHVH